MPSAQMFKSLYDAQMSKAFLRTICVSRNKRLWWTMDLWTMHISVALMDYEGIPALRPKGGCRWSNHRLHYPEVPYHLSFLIYLSLTLYWPQQGHKTGWRVLPFKTAVNLKLVLSRFGLRSSEVHSSHRDTLPADDPSSGQRTTRRLIAYRTSDQSSNLFEIAS